MRLLLALLVPLSVRATCRMDPSAANNGCGLPYELSNFQGEHKCNPAALIGTPPDYDSLRQILAAFPRVQAVGVGHSWNHGFFCPGNDSKSVGIPMTEIKNVQALYTGPSSGSLSNFPIAVNESEATVWVSAGVSQRILLDYLANYNGGSSPEGWTLPAFSWFIDQTIGGAVATGTHGSSLRFGSLSSQVLALEVMLANGTVANVTADSDPHLFRAFRVSVGRLGIILRLKMRIVQQLAVRRTLSEIKFNDLLTNLKSFQSSFRAAVASGDPTSVNAALQQLDEVQALVFFPTSNVWWVTFEKLSVEPEGALLNLGPATDQVNAFDGPPDVAPQVGKRPVPPNSMIGLSPTLWSNLMATSLRSTVASGTFERRSAYLTFSAPLTRQSEATPYDQYEVSVPLETVSDCFEAVGAAIYGPDRLSDGFRSPGLLRFVAAEDAYLSTTYGGARAFLNIEDYLTLSTGVRNTKFDKVVALFMSHPKCMARLHWGKGGWTTDTGGFNVNFDGASVYPRWCDFGCAVAELDPTGKFSTERPDLWTFRAAYLNSSSAVSDFTVCCTPQGFQYDQCRCLSQSASNGVLAS